MMYYYKIIYVKLLFLMFALGMHGENRYAISRSNCGAYGGIIADISTGQNIQPRLYNIMSSTGAVCCDPTDIVWRRSAHEKAEGGNGKELDRTNNLFWYDFLARPYDSTRGQFTGPDMLAENYYAWNPFTFCLNNPLKYVDPDGRDGVKIIDNENKTITIKANYYVQTTSRISKVNLSKRLDGYTSCEYIHVPSFSNPIIKVYFCPTFIGPCRN